MSRTCAQHPGVRASARCSRCRKDVCAPCTVTMPTGVFCSIECSLSLDAAKREKALWAGFKPSAWATFGIILFVIVALLVGYHFFVEKLPWQPGWRDKMRQVDVIGLMLRAAQKSPTRP